MAAEFTHKNTEGLPGKVPGKTFGLETLILFKKRIFYLRNFKTQICYRKALFTPPSRSWQGCAVYRRRCRGGGLRNRQAVAKVRLKQAV